MADPVRNYLDAKKKYEAASSKTSDMIAMVSEVSKSLQADATKFAFANSGVSLPVELAFQPLATPSPDANRWPTAVQIQQTVCDLIAAKSELHSAWSSLAPDDRAGVQAPPERFVSTKRPAHV